MKLREVKELRAKTVEDLHSFEGELSQELFQARIKHGVGQLENTARLQELRRDIARVKTELKKRAIEGAKEE